MKHFPFETMHSFVLFFLLTSSLCLTWRAVLFLRGYLFCANVAGIGYVSGFLFGGVIFVAWDEIWMVFVFLGIILN